MKEKYELLLSLKLLEYEIKELTIYSKECCECFELLKNKLDFLCQFITCESNENQWGLWGNDQEIIEYSGRLREASVKALCDMEKHQSVCTYNHELDISEYIHRLSHAVKDELEEFLINDQSKVLFIGAGAFPTSALTIAKETGAMVMGLDIDLEAVDLAEKVTKVSGLESKVKFSSQRLDELAFVKEATHIIIASLVKNKYEVLDGLKKVINTNTKVILRYGNGLKSIFNYPLEDDLSGEWVQNKISKKTNIYDTIVLEKSKLYV